ncbi:hypothetical protein, partial [Rhizobium mesoamericanum]|uniref:hypothetical protein n=1 Tax=Rhizobium mesoamericanum TaxID=1079800 RepID=UPI001AD831B5
SRNRFKFEKIRWTSGIATGARRPESVRKPPDSSPARRGAASAALHQLFDSNPPVTTIID